MKNIIITVLNLYVPAQIKHRHTASLQPSAETGKMMELQPEGNLSLHQSPHPTDSETLRNMSQSEDRNQSK